LAPAPELHGPKNKKTYYLYNSLAPQAMCVKPDPKIQAPAPPPKCF